MIEPFSADVTIQAKPAAVWAALTQPARMTEWLAEPEAQIQVITNWQINTSITIRGFHHVKFENKGIVLRFDQERKVAYTHLSSVSRLPDTAENYSILEFTLTPTNQFTHLRLTIENFPTESIQKHLEFYWRTTLFLIKEQVEQA
ncbi:MULTISPECIES: SRPBCC family protein [Spirosoma]|uniref:SRPBCC domain-containing protein n=1 Tax=Spirosoma liriopis TaxID=2937440 RepID=A0ABT0HU08_9BACT|nr:MULTISPECIES: SRPBCC domain-containing protein [Spirosoma]MCK8495612.1 SRPBCC domain-containing protein [Spirosoma liriopis]